jgi:hypothetical protein
MLPATPVAPLPGWLAIRHVDPTATSAGAFLAGAGLLAVDRIVRAEPVWLGALRQRQALAAAVASTKTLRVVTDDTGLRDAHHLTRPGNDPGPAGRVYRVWRGFASGPVRLDQATLLRLAAGLDLPLTDTAAGRIVAAVRGATPIERAVAVASATLAETVANRASGSVLAGMGADLALAAACGWPHPLPLLACARPSLRFARSDGSVMTHGDPDWSAACHAAYSEALASAHGRAMELARRCEALQAAFSYVRSKGGEQALASILNDDSVMATTLSGLGSERAARRFLERLHGLGGLRLLTDRATFRLYGV